MAPASESLTRTLPKRSAATPTGSCEPALRSIDRSGAWFSTPVVEYSRTALYPLSVDHRWEPSGVMAMSLAYDNAVLGPEIRFSEALAPFAVVLKAGSVELLKLPSQTRLPAGSSASPSGFDTSVEGVMTRIGATLPSASAANSSICPAP